MSKQIVLVAHGKLAIEMKRSAEMICGELPTFEAVSFEVEEGLESISHKLMDKINGYDGETIIFADLFCGTPYNAACKIALNDKGKFIKVLSGMSLPLVLELASSLTRYTVDELCNQMKALSSSVVKVFEPECIAEEEEL